MRKAAFIPRSLGVVGLILKKVNKITEKAGIALIVVSIIGFFLTAILTTPIAKAQYYPVKSYQNSYAAPYTNPDVPKNLHTYTQSVTIEVMSSLVCQLTGIDPVTSSNRCLGIDTKTKKIGYIDGNGGLIGSVSNMIGYMYTIPVHTSDYTTYMAGNFGISKTAYAETGADQLSPLLDAWKAFRDLVYLLFVFMFTVVGLGIMLRLKIDPRSVMTIQNQLPKIIITLIAITFSYAIAGFMVDMMWILLLFILNIFHQADPTGINVGSNVANLGSTPFGFLSNLFGGIWGDLVPNAAWNIAEIVNNLVSNALGGGFLTAGWWAGKLFGAVAFIAGALVIAIAIAFSLFRLWFTLLKAYILVLSATILGPFWILIGLWPYGTSVRFASWIRYLGSSLSTFLAAVIIFLLGKTIVDTVGHSQDGFVPPLIGSSSSEVLASLLGFGIILIAPNANKYAKRIFKPPEIDYTPLTQALGAGVGVPSQAGKTVGGATTAYRYDITGAQSTDRKAGFGRVVQFISRGGR